jgi:predicted metalloprotease with PDZ domain
MFRSIAPTRVTKAQKKNPRRHKRPNTNIIVRTIILIRLIQSTILILASSKRVLANSNSILGSAVMSKFIGLAAKVILLISTYCACHNFCAAQKAEVSITIQHGDTQTAIVHGKFLENVTDRELRFLTRFGHLSELDKRMTGIELFTRKGEPISSHAVSPGRFIAESDFVEWKYQVNIAASKDRFAAAHVSWVDGDGAMIALRDLIPQGLKAAKLKVVVPPAWRLFANAKANDNHVFEIDDLDKTIFHAGTDLRASTFGPPGSEIELLVSGDWYFTDAEAAQMADSIFASYEKLFGGAPASNVQIAVRQFPISVARGEWEADSRGSSITIMSSDMPFKSQSCQRLHEQLRHEIFHLWIPNALKLTGNYDWFYEGFALYNSLKTGVFANRISFNDFLDTLGRAYEIGNATGDQMSLIKESENRWGGSNTMVYARGMIIAFACDVAMIKASKGKRSIAEILKKVFSDNRLSTERNGNEAVLAVLSADKEIRPIVDASITGSARIDWKALLEDTGLTVDTRGPAGRLRVVDELTGRQKEVLDRLGYNNWRKSPRSEK